MKAEIETRVIEWRCVHCGANGELELAQSDDCMTIWRRITREHTGCQKESGIAIAEPQRRKR